MSLISGFNAKEVEPQVAGELLPDGWYTVVIDKSTTKTTNAGDGQFLELEFVVMEGSGKSRRVWDRLNLDNPSQTAVEIARASLSAICHAVGVLEPKSESDLHDKPLEIRVVTQPANEKKGYGPSNVVKGYRPVGAGKDKPTSFATNKKGQQVDRTGLPLSEPNDGLPF